MESKIIALVTGANKGIGFEVTRQLGVKGIHVIMTSRDEKKGQAAFERMQNHGLDISFQKLDVTDKEDIKWLSSFIKKEYGKLDILVNNAGVFLDNRDSEDVSIFHSKVDTIRNTLETNTFGALLLCQEFIPLMKKNNYGRIVNVSSGMGQLSDMNGGYAGYRLSKVSLNALTKIFADELKETNVLINSVCPGWVKTDMGGPNATRSVEEGVETIVWLATLPDSGPSGGFFRDKEIIPW